MQRVTVTGGDQGKQFSHIERMRKDLRRYISQVVGACKKEGKTKEMG